jgi:hypothetical protein
MENIKQNKTFQTIVGAGVIYLAFVLWRDGWVEWAFSSEPQDGYGNSQLVLAVGAALLSFTQMVGIVTIGIVSGVLPHLSTLGEWLARIAKAGSERLPAALKGLRESSASSEWNWKPLAAIVLAFFVWQSGSLPKIVDTVKGWIVSEEVRGKPQAVIWVLGDRVTANQWDVAKSLKVEEALIRAGIEGRRILSGQDLAKAERWLQEAVDAAGGDSCLILAGDRGISVRALPSDTGAFIREVDQWAS